MIQTRCDFLPNGSIWKRIELVWWLFFGALWFSLALCAGPISACQAKSAESTPGKLIERKALIAAEHGKVTGLMVSNDSLLICSTLLSGSHRRIHT